MKGSYPFEDFLADFDALNDAGSLNVSPWEAVASYAANHFRAKYPDQNDQMFRYTRFMMTLDFLSEHLKEFDRDDLAVYGSDRVGGLVGVHLLRGAHHCFCSRSAREYNDITVEEIIQEARRLKELETIRLVK